MNKSNWHLNQNNLYRSPLTKQSSAHPLDENDIPLTPTNEWWKRIYKSVLHSVLHFINLIKELFYKSEPSRETPIVGKEKKSMVWSLDQATAHVHHSGGLQWADPEPYWLSRRGSLSVCAVSVLNIAVHSFLTGAFKTLRFAPTWTIGKPYPPIAQMFLWSIKPCGHCWRSLRWPCCV